MRAPSNREWVLLVMLGVVAIAILYFSEGNLLSGGRTAVDAEGQEFDEAPVVHLSRLGREPENFDPNARDLFKYGPPPRVGAPPPPTRVVAPPPTRTVQPPAKVPKRTPPPRVVREPAGPRPPKPNFSYLGFLGPKENRIFVFADGTDLMLARVGEVVQEEFKVVEFKYEAVVMGYTDDRFADMTTELTWNR